MGLLAALEDVGLIIWNLIAAPFIGRERLRWGTVEAEATDPLPGEDLIQQPKWSYTLGVPIAASPENVWPWIARIGQTRGGFYSCQTPENMFGCKITNTTEILPEFQDPQIDDEIHLDPTSPAMKIATVDPPHALVLFGSPADLGRQDSWAISTWQLSSCRSPTAAAGC